MKKFKKSTIFPRAKNWDLSLFPREIQTIRVFQHILILLLTPALSVFANPKQPTPKEKTTIPEVRSLIDIRVTVQEPDYRTPWRKKNPTYYQGIGIYIGKNQVLVPAQLVRFHTLVEGRTQEQKTPIYGKLLRIDNDLGLAVIQFPESSKLFQALTPIPFSKQIPRSQSLRIHSLDDSGSWFRARATLGKMQIANYPGGRVELPFWEITSNEKLQGKGELIRSQEAGNLGILVEFQNSTGKGKAIPSDVIERFLNGSIHPYHKGFFYRPIHDRSTREYYQIPKDKNGILVTEILMGGSADGILQKEDILLEFAQYPLDGDGQIQHPRYGKIGFPIVLLEKDRNPKTLGNEKIPIQVLRGGKTIHLELPLKPFPEECVLIPFEKQENVHPGYMVVGGLVFMELTEFYLKEAGRNWRSLVDKKMLYLLDYHKFRKDKESPERLVYLMSVLPDEENNGYHNLAGNRVTHFQDTPIRSLEHFYTLSQQFIQDPSSGLYWKIQLENGSIVVFDKKKIPSINRKIQELYQIPQLFIHPSKPHGVRER